MVMVELLTAIPCSESGTQVGACRLDNQGSDRISHDDSSPATGGRMFTCAVASNPCDVCGVSYLTMKIVIDTR